MPGANTLFSQHSEHSRDRVNPYRARILEYRGKLFSPKHVENDYQEIKNIFASNAQSCGSEVIVEIGSGSGAHLIELAERNPQHVVLGFELRYKRLVRTMEKASARGISNLYLIQLDGQNLYDLFGKKSLSAIYINFPDPWAKPKQQKHRLLTPTFIEKAAYLLRESGTLSFKTDHGEYFEKVFSDLSGQDSLEIVEITENLYSSSFLEANIPTEFERLFVSQKKPIYYLKAAKTRKEE